MPFGLLSLAAPVAQSAVESGALDGALGGGSTSPPPLPSQDQQTTNTVTFGGAQRIIRESPINAETIIAVSVVALIGYVLFRKR